jgi:hypothetical protein
MTFPIGSEGNGAGKGIIDVAPVCAGCDLFLPNPQQPPPEGDLPFGIAEVLQKWQLATRARVRAILPVIRAGNMVGLFVWWDPPGGPPPEGGMRTGT